MLIPIDIMPYQNKYGYWVARVLRGEYRTTSVWAIKKRWAVGMLRDIIDKIEGSVEEAKAIVDDTLALQVQQ